MLRTAIHLRVIPRLKKEKKGTSAAPLYLRGLL